MATTDSILSTLAKCLMAAAVAAVRSGKIVGGETIRPLLKSLPRADADALRARLETP